MRSGSTESALSVGSTESALSGGSGAEAHASDEPRDPPETVDDMYPVLIAPMKRRHLRGVVAIENSCNSRPWSENLFLGELKMPISRIYNVALDAHRVLGYCGLMLIADEGHITNVAVEPTVRRKGLARRLVGQTIREAREKGVTALTLEVRASNRAAQELYRRFGFAPSGVRPRYYSDPVEDALIMWAHDVDTADYDARLESLHV